MPLLLVAFSSNWHHNDFKYLNYIIRHQICCFVYLIIEENETAIILLTDKKPYLLNHISAMKPDPKGSRNIVGFE